MSPLTMEEKYKVLAPENMQEAAMSDSEEEGGIGVHFLIDKLYSPYNGSIIKIVKKNLTNLTIY